MATDTHRRTDTDTNNRGKAGAVVLLLVDFGTPSKEMASNVPIMEIIGFIELQGLYLQIQ